MEYVASRVVLIMVMVRGGCSESFRKSSDDMDDLGRSMHEDEPDRLILGYERATLRRDLRYSLALSSGGYSCHCTGWASLLSRDRLNCK